MEGVPSDLASLVNFPSRIVDEANVLPYNSRRKSIEPAKFPTPKGGEIIPYPGPYVAKMAFDFEEGTSSVDFLRLDFKPNQVGQFRSDLYPPDWIPVRSCIAVAFNKWRRAIVMDPGCERFRWGICEAPAVNVVVLLICNNPQFPSGYQNSSIY